MFLVIYCFTVILGCMYVYKTLSNDPEKDTIWGDALLTEKEKEIELLKTQLNHYKTYRSPAERLPSREESMV